MRFGYLSALVAALLLAVCGSVTAQAIAPIANTDAGIKGYGTLKTPDGSLGVFSVSVVRSGSGLTGYFQYYERANAGSVYYRKNYVYTKQITSLQVTGNTAIVRATGIFNNQPANLTFEALDDNPSGDWVRITATPQGMLPYTWSVAGGVASGDVTIWSAPAPQLYAKGEGVISIQYDRMSIAPREGYFSFFVEPSKTDSIYSYNGTLTFTDACIRPATYADRMPVRVYVPRIDWASFVGTTVTMRGKGTINGSPCIVEAVATDTSKLMTLLPMPDKFEIKVYTSNADKPVYQANGPVIKGDIFVSQ